MLRRSTIPIINYCFVVPIYRTIIVFPWKSFRQPVRRLVPLCRSCAVHDANDGRRPDLAPRTAVLNFVSTGVCAWSLFLPHRPPYRVGSRATPRARPPVCRSRSAEKDGVSNGPTNKKKKIIVIIKTKKPFKNRSSFVGDTLREQIISVFFIRHSFTPYQSWRSKISFFVRFSPNKENNSQFVLSTFSLTTRRRFFGPRLQRGMDPSSAFVVRRPLQYRSPATSA